MSTMDAQDVGADAEEAGDEQLDELLALIATGQQVNAEPLQQQQSTHSTSKILLQGVFL